MAHRTLFERIWTSHVVVEPADEPALLYVDLHLIHEVTSPQAFEGLRLAGRRVRRPDLSGALAFGIGTSDVEHVLATQTLPQRKPWTMRGNFHGELAAGVAAKDMILAAIGQAGISGGVGYVVEYDGPAIRSLSMESRMTVCNMSIEWGARAGMIAPDDTTFSYMEGRPGVPDGADWERALDEWRSLAGDSDAAFDQELSVDVSRLAPQVTWGTNPEMVVPVHGEVPDPEESDDP